MWLDRLTGRLDRCTTEIGRFFLAPPETPPPPGAARPPTNRTAGGDHRLVRLPQRGHALPCHSPRSRSRPGEAARGPAGGLPDDDRAPGRVARPGPADTRSGARDPASGPARRVVARRGRRPRREG